MSTTLFIVPPLFKSVTEGLPPMLILGAAEIGIAATAKGYWAIEKSAIKYNIPARIYFIESPVRDEDVVAIPCEEWQIQKYFDIKGTHARLRRANEPDPEMLTFKKIKTSEGVGIFMVPTQKDESLFYPFDCRKGQIIK